VNLALDCHRTSVVSNVNVQVLLLDARQLGSHDVLFGLLRDLYMRLTLVMVRSLSWARVGGGWVVLDETEDGVKVIEKAASKRHGWDQVE
jgi:hypothetical protein